MAHVELDRAAAPQRAPAVPWVHVFNGKVWKREGVGEEADVFVGLACST